MANQLDRLAGLLQEVWDVVEGRVVESNAPAWCVRRGWDRFLLGLEESDLVRCEHVGLGALAKELGAPNSLQDLARAIAATTRAISPAPPLVAADAKDGASARKRGQVEAIARLCAARPGGYRRVVDVGAGLGHLTRELASALEVDALGLERDAARVASAQALTEQVASAVAGSTTTFVTFDAVSEPLAFRRGDLAVGLHACGSLGDALVVAAARDRVDLLLVNCCLQHVEGAERQPLSACGRDAGLVLRRDLVGLSNLGGRRRVGGTTTRVMRTRTTRHAMRLLLRGRGLAVEYGEEMRGLQLRKARKGLGHLATAALKRRGLAPATAEELTRCEALAEREFARIRRLSLPRGMLGRLLELAIVLDRACALEEAGHAVQVRAVFDFDLSPRNLGIVSTAPEQNGEPAS